MKRLLALGLLFAAASSSAENRPNIVVLDICSARADRFGPFGGKGGLTPGLDAFAREAAAFENSWAQASWCLPNYATILTGHRPEVDGLVADLPFRPLPDWDETIAVRLKKAGYRTGAFSSGVHALPSWGLDRGFDKYVDHYSTEEDKPGRFADETAEIENWVDEPSAKPFFLYATVDDLHTPYQSGEPPAAGEPAGDDVINVGFYNAYNGSVPATDAALAARLAAFRKDPRSIPALNRRYDAAVRAVDRSITAFLADLKKRGLWENTIVIVTADHGESLGEHGLLGHNEGLYQPVLRVPTLLRDPRVPASAGARIGALVERVDLAPTILEAAGADGSGLEFQGLSVLPLLKDPKAPWRKIAYASSKRALGGSGDFEIDERAVRDQRWKLIWPRAKGRFELYDLKNDPGELLDLAAARPDVVARLAFELEVETERARTHAAGTPSGRADSPQD